MNLPTVDLEQGSEDLRREVAHLRRIVRGLRGSEERLRMIIDAEPECVKMLGPDGTLLEMNPAGLRMVEADSLEQVRNQCVYSLIVPEHRAAFRDLTERVFRGESGTFHFQIIGLKGGRRWLETHASPLHDSSGRVDVLLGITRDITEQKEAEEKLRASEQRLMSIYNTVGDVIFHLAVEGEDSYRFASINPAFSRVTGLAVETVVGKNIAAIIPESSLGQVLQNYRRAIKQKTIVRWEETSDYAAGSLVGEVSVAPVFDETGRCTHLVGSVHDITDRKRVEKELMESQRQLRSLAARLRKVREEEAIRISREIHDQLGQALTGLRMDVEMLQNFCRAGTPPGALAEAEHRLKKMITAIDDTISLARRVSAELRPPLLDALGLSAALEWEAREFEARSSIFCNISLPPEEPRISRECATAVFRIFQELLTNIARHAQASEISIAFVANEADATLTVQDDGVGFDPREARPAGLGMIGMHERARACGLTLKVKSIPGEGTTAIVRIPADACL
jgi:PAS domain S-box-containing protein